MKPDKSDKIQPFQANFLNNKGPASTLSYDVLNKERESTQQAKQRFLEVFESRIGGLSISEAAEKAGISRDTYYRWLHDDKEFKDRVKCARNCLNDLVEDLLFEKIQEKDTACIRYYLDHRHPDYRKKSDLQLKREYQDQELDRLVNASRGEFKNF